MSMDTYKQDGGAAVSAVTREGAGKTLWSSIFKARWIYAALVPSFLLLVVFNLYPAVDAIRKSFFFWKMSNYRNVRFVGLDNYLDLLQDAVFWKSFGTLAIFILWGFIVTFAILMPVTYLVYRLGDSRSGKWVQRLYVIPMMVPAMVIILFWRFFYDYQFGILNTVLKNIGLSEYVRVWLGEKATALPSLLFMGFPWVGGFGFLILLAGFQGIDTALHEAAKIDGATAMDQFFRIDIPLIIPQAKILIILGMIGGLQQYGTQMIMTRGGPDYSTTVPGLIMFDTAFKLQNFGYGATQGVALFVIILVITIINNKYIQGKE
jgi:raffinose/stachyose/melibiose transport system permease protein